MKKPTPFERFDDLVKHVVSVPKAKVIESKRKRKTRKRKATR